MMQQSQPANRREFQRYAISLSVEIYCGTEPILAVAQNLSAGGVGVQCTCALPEQHEVTVSMFLVEDGIEDGDCPPLNMQAQIIWCTEADQGGGYLAGLRFGPSTPQQQQMLTHFLSRLNPG